MKNTNTVTLKMDVWTIREGDEIVLSTSLAEEVRAKIAALKLSEKTYFSLSNNWEEWSRKWVRTQENQYRIEYLKYIWQPIII
jgi:hypothetical protein